MEKPRYSRLLISAFSFALRASVPAALISFPSIAYARENNRALVSQLQQQNCEFLLTVGLGNDASSSPRRISKSYSCDQDYITVQPGEILNELDTDTLPPDCNLRALLASNMYTSDGPKKEAIIPCDATAVLISTEGLLGGINQQKTAQLPENSRPEVEEAVLISSTPEEECRLLLTSTLLVNPPQAHQSSNTYSCQEDFLSIHPADILDKMEVDNPPKDCKIETLLTVENSTSDGPKQKSTFSCTDMAVLIPTQKLLDEIVYVEKVHEESEDSTGNWLVGTAGVVGLAIARVFLIGFARAGAVLISEYISSKLNRRRYY